MHWRFGDTIYWAKFKISTDCKSLKWIFTQPDLNMQQRRWMELLHEYNFDIHYQPGKKNVVADALSKNCAISSLQSNLSQEIQQAYPTDRLYINIVNTLRKSDKSNNDKRIIEGFHLSNDLLYFLHTQWQQHKAEDTFQSSQHTYFFSPWIHKNLQQPQKKFLLDQPQERCFILCD